VEDAPPAGDDAEAPAAPAAEDAPAEGDASASSEDAPEAADERGA